MVDLERAGETVNRLRRAGNNIGSVESDAADVIQELMHEVQRWQIRAGRAERGAQRVITELREAWSGRDADAIDAGRE